MHLCVSVILLHCTGFAAQSTFTPQSQSCNARTLQQTALILPSLHFLFLPPIPPVRCAFSDRLAPNPRPPGIPDAWALLLTEIQWTCCVLLLQRGTGATR